MAMAMDALYGLFAHDQHRVANHYDGEQFFEKENYQSILDCLNGGYEAAQTVIKSMEEYLRFRQEEADHLTTYSKTCVARLQCLSSLSTYHTTMNAQLHTYQSFEKQAKTIHKSCAQLQEVIDEYTEQVNTMYPPVHFHTPRRHYKSDEMKLLFNTARAPFNEARKRLHDLREKATKLTDSINHETKKAQNRHRESSANVKLQELRDELKTIEKAVVIAVKKEKETKEDYIAEGKDIFQQCQEFEKERLDQIQQTLAKFIQAIHPSHYAPALSKTCEKLLTNIKLHQNSNEDLSHWAITYGVHKED